MAELHVTWMDGKQETYPLTYGDQVSVKDGVLSVFHPQYPARTDRERYRRFPLANVRTWTEYE